MKTTRALLVTTLTLGLVTVLMGCEPQSTRPPTTTEPVKAPEAKTPPVQTPVAVTGSATTPAAARAVAPKGPALPPEAGKTVADKTVIRTACGSAKNYTDKKGVVWSADQAYSAANKWGYLGKGPTNTNSSTHPLEALDPLYCTERWGMTGYQYDVPNGKYIVRMHFAEIYDQVAQEGMRVFTVNLQGKPVLDSFDITKDAGGFGKVVVKEFPATVTNGKLVIGFAKTTSRPIIQAIEVLGQ